jgi:hypothetical protein
MLNNFTPCHRLHNFRTNLLMLLRKTIVVCCEKHKEHANALKVKILSVFNATAGDTYNTHITTTFGTYNNL